MLEEEKRKKTFEDVIEQHKGILFKIARSYCQNADDREDLMQETMIQIWQSLQKYNGQAKMSTWLYRIALNVAISFYRKNSTRAKKYTVLTVQQDKILITDNSEEEFKLNQLQKFISELKEIDKAIMILYLEDKSHLEISEILGMSITNVGTKIGRIKENLKKRFTELKA